MIIRKVCAQYLLELDVESLSKRFSNLRVDLSEEDLAQRSWHLFPKYRGPILRFHENQTQLETLEFGLVPKWDKEMKKRFHNARVETVDEKPSFRGEFVKSHCLVPMSGFFEYIWQDDKNNWLAKFFPNDHELLFAAGIYSERRGFSILTMPPPPEILKVGHDRSPLFLKPERTNEWLLNEGEEGADLKKFLREAYFYPRFSHKEVEKKSNTRKKAASTVGSTKED